MNLLLLDHDELGPEGHVQLTGDRARHLIAVLKVTSGSVLRAGLLDGPRGTAEVLAVADRTVELRVVCEDPAPSPGRDTLLLAFARPKVLSRCLEHATALGFGRIVLFRSRRVEKSHLSSHALSPAAIQERLRRGLEQSRRTHRPEVICVQRFRELLEQQLDALVPRDNRFVADPDAAHEAALCRISSEPLSIVIGPEGGLIDHELESFAARGFQLVRTGQQPLRVETALSYVIGQLRAAQAIGTRA